MLLNFVLTGAGIYVTNSQLSYSSRSLPNNSIITINTNHYSWHRSATTMSFYCCSNSTSGYTGTFIGLNGYSYSGSIRVRRHSFSDSYTGCMYIYSQDHLGTSKQGIYTCRMPDSAGRNIDINVGIYLHGYTSEFLLLCTSRSSAVHLALI